MKKLLVLVIALAIACAATFTGTLAYFTDEDVAELNVVEAGTLDIELLDAEGKDVDESDILFVAPELWEPGAMAFANVKVQNKGNLDFWYNVALNYVGENAVVETVAVKDENGNVTTEEVAGAKLSDVLKVAFTDKMVTKETPRDEVLKLFADETKTYDLETCNLGIKELEAGVTSDVIGLVVYWEPQGSEIDNRYNLNNGKTTTDGKALHIEMGVKVTATQLNSEEDAFDSEYDEDAKDQIRTDLPYANVISLEHELDDGRIIHGASFVAAEADSDVVAKYGKWHADFVISVDQAAVLGEDFDMAGQYDEAGSVWYVVSDWIEPISVAPGEPVRVMETAAQIMGGNDFIITYNDVLEFVKKFNCGVIVPEGSSLPDETTFSVQLRLYEVAEDGTETGNSYPIGGTYTYTYTK